jgi:hypothetical protein
MTRYCRKYVLRKMVGLDLLPEEWRDFRAACKDEATSIGAAISGFCREFVRVRQAALERLWEQRGLGKGRS